MSKRKRPLKPAQRAAWVEARVWRWCDGSAGQKPCVRRDGHRGRCSSAVAMREAGRGG